jgi:hypothetical protein
VSAAAAASTLLAGSVRCDNLAPRIASLLGSANLARNGIDYVEIDPADHAHLWIVFLRPVPPAGYGLPADPSMLSIAGGVRITGVRARSVVVVAPNRLEVRVNRAGDHSPYILTLSHPDLDPPLSQVAISFTATCPTDTDCVAPGCPPETFDEPLIDYLARDYASFVRLLSDVAATRHGSFTDANAADVAETVLELFAYTGDRLAYFQDAAATEAYLDTARQRRSVRRHARLVDYRVHEGRNAATWVTLTVASDGVVPQATPLLTRVDSPLAPGQAPPGVLVAPSWLDPLNPAVFEANPALSRVMVFETAHPQAVSPANNEIAVHTWGNDDCALATGAQDAWLYSVQGVTAGLPALADGDFLVFEEVRGPTGEGWPADADPAHRVVVRIEGKPEATTDELFSATLAVETDPVSRIHQLVVADWAAGATLPLLHVRWRRADALAFPLCLSATTTDGRHLRSVSVARGNVVAADHGRTVTEAAPAVAAGLRPVQLRLTRGPLTQESPTTDGRYDNQTGRPVSGRHDLAAAPGEAIAAATVRVTTSSGTDVWTPVPDLLDSTAFDHHLVAEPGGSLAGDGGTAAPPVLDADTGSAGPGLAAAAGSLVRFGDGTYGADPEAGRPPRSVTYQVVYRVGNGPGGDVGADTLVHVVGPPAVAPTWPVITSVRNPLPAGGGAAPEPIAHVRVAAPVAFSVDQLRAVTEDDYARAVLRLASVRSSVARFRWTGSWLTVFVGVDPADPSDLVPASDGRFELSATVARQVTAQLERFRQAGYDLEIQPPAFVALDVVLDVCVAAGHFRSEVLAEVRAAMGAGCRSDAAPAFFNQDRWSFGQPVWLSAIYAAVEAVPGVDSVAVRRLRRLGQADNGELAAGKLVIGAAEIARCDNAADFVEHGVLTVAGHGGKG